eukprot:symbB.v1.2.000647.t1/scaffold28.1/size414311/1
MTVDEAKIFPPLIKELEKRLEEVDLGMQRGEVLSRKEFSMACWRIGRTTRQMIKPEFSEERGILWHECKGALKQVLVLEKFQHAVFMDNCVRTDVVEKHLAEMLRSLLPYLKKRQTGEIPAPIEKEEARPAKRRKSAATEANDEESKTESKGDNKDGKGKDVKGQKGTGKYGRAGWWDDAANLGTVHVISQLKHFEESDPEEECPDKAFQLRGKQ